MSNITIPLGKLLEVQEKAVSLYKDYCEREETAWSKWKLDNPQPCMSDMNNRMLWGSEYLHIIVDGVIPCTQEEALGGFLKDFSREYAESAVVEITSEQYKAYQKLSQEQKHKGEYYEQEAVH